VVFGFYQRFGFPKIEELIAQLSPKTLDSLIKKIPEAKPFVKLNSENMKKVYGQEKSYGGGGSFGWAPNLNQTAQKEPP